MRRDHPLVLLCYFGTVLVLSMLTMHPLSLIHISEPTRPY